VEYPIYSRKYTSGDVIDAWDLEYGTSAVLTKLYTGDFEKALILLKDLTEKNFDFC
jgi:hypothetical protein